MLKGGGPKMTVKNVKNTRVPPFSEKYMVPPYCECEWFNAQDEVKKTGIQCDVT